MTRSALLPPPPPMAPLLFLAFVALVVRFLVGCGPAWGPAASAAATAAQGVACAVCGAHVPPAPAAVSKEAASLTVQDILAILAWGAELQKAASKELAERAQKVGE